MKKPLIGAWVILLTSISPNLEAAFADITTNPYEVLPPSTLRADPIPAPLDWSGSLIDFEQITPQGLSHTATGTLSLFIEKQPPQVQSFVGKILPTREFTLITNLGANLVQLDGIFTEDYLGGLGLVSSLGDDTVTGFFEVQAVELPAALGLFLFALASIPFFARQT